MDKWETANHSRIGEIVPRFRGVITQPQIASKKAKQRKQSHPISSNLLCL